MTAEELETTPIGYAEAYLNDNPVDVITGEKERWLYDWQCKAIARLELATGPHAVRQNISVVTPNGAGKDDRIIPAAAYWWVGMHPRGTVVITSRSDLQLTQQTIPALKRHMHKFGYSSVDSPRFELRTKTGGRIVAFVTNHPSRVEGWHKSDDIKGPLLLIVNEAKSIDEEIFQGLDRWTPNAVMMVSSPGPMLGRFFQTHTSLRDQWTTVKAGLIDCPHIPQDRILNTIRTYGENHPFTRSSIYGEFMEQDEANKYVVTHSQLERCLNNPPPFRPGSKVAFCDFAGGGDENVIALREGNRITLEAHWREKDKSSAVGRFIQHFRRLELKPDQIWGDAAAKDMLDQLTESGWGVNRQNFGNTAHQDDVYLSWGAEAWLEAANEIEKCAVILPRDESLIAQLTSRQKGISARGKLSIEEKYSMRKRNLPSPDRADAVVGAMAVHGIAGFEKDQFHIPSGIFTDGWSEYSDQAEIAEEMGAGVGL